MKVTKIAVGLMAATLLMSACKNDTSPAAGSQTATVGSATDTTGANTSLQPVESIVYINSDTLLNNYQYFKEVSGRLKTKAERTEKNLRSEADAFQKEVAKYQQTGGAMTEQQRMSTEEKLAQKQQMLQMKSQNAGNDIAKEEADEMKKLYDKIEDYLKSYSQEKGHKMVLTYSRGNSAILYSDSTLDVTQEVLVGLNEAYANEKSEAAAAAPAKKK